MNAGKVISYLQGRRRLGHLYREGYMLDGGRYSFESPHTCRHCEVVHLQLGREYETFVCIGCLERVSPDAAADTTRPPCPCCGLEYDILAHTKANYSAKLTCRLPAAVGAALDGCVLYETVVDAVCRDAGSLSADWERADVMEDIMAKLELGISGVTWLSDTNAIGKFYLDLAMGGPDGLSGVFDLGVQGWTTAADAVSEYIQARPYERDVQSSVSQQFARECLRTCMEEHPRCRSSRPASMSSPERVNFANLPSRLVDTCPGPGAQGVRVVEVHDIDAEAKDRLSFKGYMTLSYCWGGDQPMKLTKSSASKLRSGVSLSSLPRTLQDAIWVARALDMRYLWIDCLCIVQDDEADKAQQITRMSTFYGNATLTLSAASAPRCTTGFLYRRENSPLAIGPVRLPLQTSDGVGMGFIYLVQETNPPADHIATRAWTLQESLLSRRLLIYAQRQLYWTCSTAFAECGGSKRTMVQRMNFGIPSLVDEIYPVSVFEHHPAFAMWDKIVAQYMTRNLGFGGDKLPAIAAIAARLVDMWHARGTNLRYAAGLLIDTSDPVSWYVQLLWRSVGPGVERAASFRAPSWSWASIDGRISPYFALPEGEYRVEASVESCQVEPALPQAPYGQVKGGELMLKARVRTLSEVERMKAVDGIFWHESSAQGEEEVLDPICRIEPEAQNGAAPRGRLLLYPDSERDRLPIGMAIDAPERAEEVFLAPIARGLADAAVQRGIHGILLAQSVSCREKYVRLGSFTIDAGRRWAFFEDAPEALLCIV